MNTELGMQRAARVWAWLVMVPAVIVAALLWMSAYEPALMKTFAVCVLVGGLAFAVPPLMRWPLKHKLAAMYFGAAGALLWATLAQGKARGASDVLVMLYIAAGVAGWLLWSGAAYIVAGFKSR